MDHDLTTAPDPGLGAGSDPGPGAATAGPGTTVRLASPGSVVASIPLLFGFHPDDSLVILGIGRSASGGRYIRHGVRIDLAEIRGRERAAALELAARLRDHEAEIAILVAFGPRGATGAKARPDHCRKLMAAFRAQIEAAPTEERVTVVDALYTCNGRWWSYMCRNPRCCPSVGTPVPAEAPPGLTTALSARGHTVYPTREALDATLAPYPPEVLARTAAAAEALDPTWYDTDAGLASARGLMDALLLRCGDLSTGGSSAAPVVSVSASVSAARSASAGSRATAGVASESGSATVSGAGGSATRRSRAAAAESPRRRGLSATVSIESAARGRSQGPGMAAAATGSPMPDTSAGTCAAAASAEPAHAGRRRATATAGIPAVSRTRTRTAAADSSRSTRRGVSATAAVAGTGTSTGIGANTDTTTGADTTARPRPSATSPSPAGSADAAAIPGARSGRRGSGVPGQAVGAAEPSADDTALISDAEAAQLLVALRNWRVRDYLACAAATEDSAERLLRLCTELARRAPHPELRLAPYALAAWAAWAIGRPSIAQCAVDRALAIDPEYKFASLIRAGLHHAIDGEGVRESAANTRRDLFGEADLDLDLQLAPDLDLTPDPGAAPAPVPSQRSTESTPTP